MKALVYLLVGIATVAAAAFGVRHYGIDVVALTGLGGPVKTTATRRIGCRSYASRGRCRVGERRLGWSVPAVCRDT